jgi:molybdopterin molybdotransferase
MTKKIDRLNAPMLPFEKALEKALLATTWKTGTEEVAIAKALGRVLREDLKSGLDIPPFNKSAMDGYAVRANDIKKASEKYPVKLDVVEDVPAGKKPEKFIKKGQAARIMTGAPMPKGADCVVMVEYTSQPGESRVSILKKGKAGSNVANAGEDIKKGDKVLLKGALIGPAEMGIASSLGKMRVKVSKKPKVVVMSTGDEVQVPGKKLNPGQIYDSNGYSLVGLALSLGCDAKFVGRVKDSPAALKKKITSVKEADMVFMTGGVSVGDYDFVIDLLTEIGVRKVFYKSKIKPGKPTFCGKKGKCLFFGLPGNPVSAMVCFELFARPCIEKMQGKSLMGMKKGMAIMEKGIKVRPGRRKFLRAKVTSQGPKVMITPYYTQKSGVLSSMMDADVLIDVPDKASELKSGQKVNILWIWEGR